jgi:hypothetical protein
VAFKYDLLQNTNFFFENFYEGVCPGMGNNAKRICHVYLDDSSDEWVLLIWKYDAKTLVAQQITDDMFVKYQETGLLKLFSTEVKTLESRADPLDLNDSNVDYATDFDEKHGCDGRSRADPLDLNDSNVDYATDFDEKHGCDGRSRADPLDLNDIADSSDEGTIFSDSEDFSRKIVFIDKSIKLLNDLFNDLTDLYDPSTSNDTGCVYSSFCNNGQSFTFYPFQYARNTSTNQSSKHLMRFSCFEMRGQKDKDDDGNEFDWNVWIR